MHSLGNWAVRAKWLLIAALVVWGTFLWANGYAECRAGGTNNLACGVISLFLAYLGVLFHALLLVIWFFSWLLP